MQNVQQQAKIALEILHGDTCTPVEDENGEKIIPAIFEIRILTNPKERFDDAGNLLPNQYTKKISWFGFFSSPERAYDALCRFKYEWVGAFVTIHPVSPAMYQQSPDKISVKRKYHKDADGNVAPEIRATSDADILYRKWLIVDIDPLRPADTSSSAEEKQLALDTANNISVYWQSKGLPEPIIADSGNGAHLLWRTRLMVDSDLHKRFLNETAALFNSSKVDIDLSIANPSRIWKIYGTATRKGESTPERPHRFATLVSVPEILYEVSGAMLTSLLPELGKEKPIKKWHSDGRMTVVGRRETLVELKDQVDPPASITSVTTSDGKKEFEIVDIFGDHKTESFVSKNSVLDPVSAPGGSVTKPEKQTQREPRTTQEIFDQIGEFTRIPGSNFYREKISALKKIQGWGYSTFPPKTKPGLIIHELKECPCHRKLTDGASALYELDNGATAFGCKHATCEFTDQDKQNKWSILKDLHEPKIDILDNKQDKKKKPLLALPYVSESIEISHGSSGNNKKKDQDTNRNSKEKSITDILFNGDEVQNNEVPDIDVDLLSEDPDTPAPKELKIKNTTSGGTVVYSQSHDLTKFDPKQKKLEKVNKIWELLASVSKSGAQASYSDIHKHYGALTFDINLLVSGSETKTKPTKLDPKPDSNPDTINKKKKKASETTVDIPLDLQGMLDAIPEEDIEKSDNDSGSVKVKVDKPGKFTKVIRGKDGRRLVDVFQDWKDMRDAIFEEFIGSADIYCSQNRLSYVDNEKNSMIAMDGPALDDQSWKLCAFIQFKQTDSGGLIAIPKSVPKRIIESFEYLRPEDRARLRKVERVISTPFFDETGELVSTAGYHLKSGTYMIGGIDVDGKTLIRKDDANNRIKEDLTINKAVTYIYDFLSDFEFESGAERANYLGTLLTPMVRSMIDGPVPMTVLEANKRGSGKSYLAKIIQTLYGEIPDAGGLPIDEESIEKLMTSILVEGKPIHLFDNVTHKVASATLDRVLTTGWFSGRLLGKTQNLHCKVVQLFLLTANNARMSPDMSRRFVRVRLKSSYANPERRNDFKIDDIIGWVKDTDNRRNVLSCLAFLVKQWVTAGKPKFKGIPTMGSYENWRNVIGNIMYFIGQKSWLSNLSEATEAVGYTDDWEPFFDAWYEKIGVEASLQQLFDLACKEGLLGGVMGRGDADQKKYAMRVGLFSRKDDIISNFSLRIEKNTHTKTFSYYLDRIPDVMTDKEKEIADRFEIKHSSNAVSVLDEINTGTLGSGSKNGSTTKYGDQSNFSPTYTPDPSYKPEMTYREREDAKDDMKPFFDDEPTEEPKEEWWQK